MDTISIAIGDARSSTCIVLPRGHELVRQLESLLPTVTTRTVSPELPVQYQHRSQAPQSFASSSIPSVGPRGGMPAQVLAQAHVPVRPPQQDQQPHRSAALIQSLLHRPSSTATSAINPVSVSTGVPAVPPRSTFRRGRMATAAEASTKRCHVVGCGKISVSRGLCRGHGGGRRCQFEGCPKSAQSRGDFCWSHGGGHRCEVPGCMRSRKSKRFCKSHMNWGSATPLVRAMALSRRTARREASPPPVSIATPSSTPLPSSNSPTRLPSLHQALHSQHTMIYGNSGNSGNSVVSPLPSMGRAAFPSVIMASSISC